MDPSTDAEFQRLLGSPGAGLGALADVVGIGSLGTLAYPSEHDGMVAAARAREAGQRGNPMPAGPRMPSSVPELIPPALRDRLPSVETIANLVLGAAPGSGDYMAARDALESSAASMSALGRGDYMSAGARGIDALAAGLGIMPFLPYLASIKGVGGATPYHIRPGIEPPTQHNPRGLPMDEASRMKRAKEMGFTQPAYHATYEDVPAFDFSRLGETTLPNVEGLSIEPWAMNLARTGAWSAKAPVGAQIDAAIEMPLMLAGKRGPKTYQSLDDLEAAVRRAGGPERYRNKMHAKGVGHVAVKDDEFGGTSFVSMAPEAIRSRFATFDPERANSADLLASAAPWLAMLGGGAGLGALYLDGEEGGM